MGNSEKLILVVEDDRDIRENLRELLTLEDYSVMTARHGQEALDLLRGQPARLPDLICLDLMMDVMDGWTFLRTLESEAPPVRDIPVIVLSAARENIPQTAGGFVKKPINLERFLESIETIA